MEAMWDRMNELGLDDYSTKFLCAGIESVEAMEAVTEADLIDDMGCTPEECEYVLTAIAKSRSEPVPSPKPVVEPPSSTTVLNDEPRPAATEVAAQQPPPPAPTIPVEEPLPSPPPPAAARPVPAAEELDPDGQGLASRVAELMNINDLLSKKVVQLTEQLEQKSTQAELLQLQEDLASANHRADEASRAAETSAERRVTELQKQCDGEIAAVRKEAEAQVRDARAEIAELKGLQTAEREVNESRLLQLETQLEKARESAAVGLRGDLDGFMAEVARLGAQLEQEKEARKAAEALAAECEGQRSAAVTALEATRIQIGELESKLSASEAFLALTLDPSPNPNPLTPVTARRPTWRRIRRALRRSSWPVARLRGKGKGAPGKELRTG